MLLVTADGVCAAGSWKLKHLTLDITIHHMILAHAETTRRELTFLASRAHIATSGRICESITGKTCAMLTARAPVVLGVPH
jgi:hypothetical protein